MTTPNPYLPDLDFTNGGWSWDDRADDANGTDGASDIEPDEDDAPGAAILLGILTSYAAIALVLLCLAAALLPFIF